MTTTLESTSARPIRFFFDEREEDGADILHAIYADGTTGPVLLPDEILAQGAEELIAELAS